MKKNFKKQVKHKNKPQYLPIFKITKFLKGLTAFFSHNLNHFKVFKVLEIHKELTIFNYGKLSLSQVKVIFVNIFLMFLRLKK